MAAKSQHKRVSADERRAEIARAAGHLFARHGYAATRLEDIAAAARVTKPIVYRHFDSKKALYLALLAKHQDDLPTFFEGVDDVFQDGSSDIVRAILGRWLDYVRENQHAWVMLFRDSSGDEEIRAFRRQVSLRAREVIAAFIADQPGAGIPAEEVEPTAELLTSGLAGLALWWIDHPDVPKPVLVEVGARICAGAAGAQAGATGAGARGGSDRSPRRRAGRPLSASR
jgi:AcrR family transcriptional regulator